MKELSYGKQLITFADINAVRKVLKSDILTQGPVIEAFEEKLAKYSGAKYAVAVSSGTAALHIVYLALGLIHGDEIITTPITFAATANAALYCGAKPVFTDIDYSTALMKIEDIEKNITPKTKIIAPVHYAGLSCDMEQIGKIAKKHKLFVVEDACHAILAERGGILVGSCEYSDAAVLSFHPVKHITTGEGGAVLTNNKELYEKMKLLRSHGITKENFESTPSSPCYQEMQLLGYNYRLTEFQAALGLSQLKKIDKFINRRREIADYYYRKLSDIEGLTLLDRPSDAFNVYHLFPILFDSKEKRDIVYYKLLEEGIKCQIHYLPVYMHPYYRKNGYDKIKKPNAEKYYSRVLSIPLYPKMSDKEVKYVAKSIIKILSEMGE